jgi:electron transport complex protein RnfE
MLSMTDPIRSTRTSLWLALALCPALAVSDTLANALGIGVSAVIASLVTAGAASAFGRWPDDLRRILCILILATCVSVTGMFMDAWTHELYRSLAIFVPLLVANISFDDLAEQCSRTGFSRALLTGLNAGALVAAVVVSLAIARELIGRGSLLHDAAHMFGDWAAPLDLQLFRADMGFLLAMLPPGAFISFGLLIAAWRWLRESVRPASQN